MFYNIHERLTSVWISEFYVIMENLIDQIPNIISDDELLTIYSWNDKVADP